MGTKSSGGSCQPVIILSALIVNGFFHLINRVQAFDSFQKPISELGKKVRLCVIGKNHAFCGSNLSVFNPNFYDIWTFFLKVDPLLGGSIVNPIGQLILLLRFFGIWCFRICFLVFFLFYRGIFFKLKAQTQHSILISYIMGIIRELHAE